MHNRYYGRGLALALVLATSGCGGGGSSGGSPTGGVTPAPTPTPSPTPAPTPTPSPSYLAASDFTADRDYPGWGVEVFGDYKAPPAGSASGTPGTTTVTVTQSDETRAAGLLYTAATRTYTVRWFDTQKSYGPTVDSLFQNVIPISRLDDFTRAHFWASDTTADYTRYVGYILWQTNTGNGNATLDSQSRSYSSIFGAKTLSSDQPTSGVVRYTFHPSVTAVQPPKAGADDLYRVIQGAWSLQIDWAARTVTGVLRLDPSPSAPAGTAALSISINGTIGNGNSQVEGTFGNGASGTFKGAVFGPRGKELAFTYRIVIDGKVAYAGVTGGTGS